LKEKEIEESFLPSAVALHTLDHWRSAALVAASVALPYLLCDCYAVFSSYTRLRTELKNSARGLAYILLGGTLPMALTVWESPDEFGINDILIEVGVLTRHLFGAVAEAQRTTEAEDDDELDDVDAVDAVAVADASKEQDAVQRHAQVILSHRDLTDVSRNMRTTYAQYVNPANIFYCPSYYIQTYASLCRLRLAWHSMTVSLALRFARPAALAPTINLTTSPFLAALKTPLRLVSVHVAFTAQRVVSAVCFAEAGGGLLARSLIGATGGDKDGALTGFFSQVFAIVGTFLQLAVLFAGAWTSRWWWSVMLLLTPVLSVDFFLQWSICDFDL